MYDIIIFFSFFFLVDVFFIFFSGIGFIHKNKQLNNVKYSMYKYTMTTEI